MRGLVLAGQQPAGAVAVAGLIHLDRVRTTRYQPAVTERATRRGTPGSRSRRRRRCAIWILLLCLGALLSRTPSRAHTAAAPAQPAVSAAFAQPPSGA